MTSINERQYQLPFCQVLAAEGETILYVSSHGPYEKGKDIISKTADGEIRAYQLKMGDIGLSDWRDIYGEIVNLVELPIELPSTGVVSNFSPFLVTNGELTDPVNEQLRASNVAWQSRGINKELRAIQKGELVDRFRNSHGAYLPNDLYDFRTFLELILRDGTSVADKRKASQLFEQIIPFEAELSKLAIQRWKVKDGALESRLAAEPQSWSTLCDEAESLSYDNIPSTLRRNPHFAIYFMLVFPQRFCRGIVKLIEDSLRAD